MSSSEKEELSFSEWCDKTFTNMYSHSDFVTSPPQTSKREFIRPKGRLQTAQVKQDRRIAVFQQEKDAPRSTSLNLSGTEESMVTVQSDDCLQAKRSSSPERWRKYPGKSLKSDQGTSSEVKNRDKNKSSVSKDRRTVITTMKVDVQRDKSRKPLRNPDIGIIKNPRSDTPKTSAGSECLEQESLTAKRCHSELSPCRKHTKSSKTKKRLRSSESNQKKRGGTESLSVTDSREDEQSVTNVSVCDDNDQDISEVSSSLDHTCVVKNADSTRGIKKEGSKSVLKENIEMLKTKEHESLATDTATKIKHRKIGKASKISKAHSGEHMGSVVSGEFEVDSANSEGEKSGVCLPLSSQASGKGKQRSRKNKPPRGIALGKDTERTTQGSVVQTATCASSSKIQRGGNHNDKDKLAKEKFVHQVSPKMHDEHSWIKVCHRKKSKTGRAGCHKTLCEEPKRKIGSGEYDVETSIEGESAKQDSFEGVFIENIVNKTKQRGTCKKDGSVNEVDQKLTKVNLDEPDCVLSSFKSPVKTKEDKLKKTTTLKKLKSKRSKSSEALDNEKVHVKEMGGEKRHSATKHHKNPTACSSGLQDTSRRLEETEKTPVKTTPSPKSNRVKSIVQDKASTKQKESISPRLKAQPQSSLFTKRVFESVLKPLATTSFKSATANSPPESAETVKASKRIDQSSKMQRKLSWPNTKVHLEHIYQAFDSAASISSENDLKAGTLDSKEPSDDGKDELTRKSSEETDGIVHLQQSKELLSKDMLPLHYETPISSKTPETQLTEGTSEVQEPEWFTIPPETKSESTSLNSKAKRFAPKFITRSTSGKNISAVEEPCTVPLCRASPESKKAYVVEWLKNHEGLQETPPSSSKPDSSVAGTRKERQSSEMGELSDSSESWEYIIDTIMQTRRDTSPRSLPPFRIISNRVDLKSKAFPEKKNVATVSPFCVHPPTSQLKAMPSTWSGPLPNLMDLNCSLETSPPFIPVTTRSLGDTNSDNTRVSISSTPVSNSGFSPCSPSPSTSNRRPVVDLAPRFHRLAQLKVQSRAGNDLVTSHASSRHARSRSLSSGDIDHENVPSTPFSQHHSPTLASSLQVGVDCKQEFRPWVSGSLGWSSTIISRTPGTITPTRFTPWSNEIPTPSSWKSSRAHQSPSIEPTHSTVNYPVSSIPYIDTHCHIDFLFQRLEYQGTYENFSRTHNFPKNYLGCLAVFCTPEGFERGALWEDLVLEKNIWVAFGCHPHHAKSYDGVVEDNIIRCMRHPKAIALGEIGLDYSNRCSSDRPLQLQVFRRQLQIALHLQKPLVIHSRDAEQDTLNVMKEIVPRTYKIHRHCFTGSPQEARNFFRAFPNSFIGLTALVTFPTAYPVHRTATEIPLNRILLETDAPYFLPKQCPRTMRWADPSMAVFVAARIAHLRRLSLDDVLLTVRQNTTKMYGI